MLNYGIIAAVSYLLGATPFGLLIARWVKGIDLRKAGSGNIGATNVTRVIGKKWGAVALLLDALKGAIPASLFPSLLPFAPDQLLHASVLAGVAAILGHMFSPWLRFKGGKGVATATGVVIVLAPWAFLIAFGLFVAVFATSRIVSLGSITAAIGFAVAQTFWLPTDPWSATNWSLAAFSYGIPALIIWQHRSNIGRLLRGEEHAFKKKTTEAT